MSFLRSRKRRTYRDVDPDEIFMDSKNLPQFDTHQFEGVIEQPIRRGSVRAMGIVFSVVGILFAWKAYALQVKNGETFFNRSVNNSLSPTPVLADRGVIYDRNGVELAWNEPNPEDPDILLRAYIREAGFAHVLGYVTHPQKDSKGNYWQKDYIAKGGVELIYDEKLRGESGVKMIERDALGNVESNSLLSPAKPGDNLRLSIDARLQHNLYKAVKSTADEAEMKGGAAALMDPYTGEIYALVSYPEYDPEVMSRGKDKAAISSYLTNKQNPFINRALSGLYTPGSIVKPFFALAALKEGVVTPSTQIYSAGSIAVPNPFFPGKETVFKDWKAHGWMDMRRAIAVSSDVYFYEVGGGFEKQRGIGIANIGKYSREFGIAEKTGIDLPGDTTGVIPDPEWKKKVFDGDIWRVGDTYNTSIGQYGFQVTLVQMLRAVAALANHGTMITPHVVTDGVATFQESKLNFPSDYYEVTDAGMRAAVTEGTAGPLNLPYIDVSAKTGTAQVGAYNQFVNSWSIGFFPSDKPALAFAVLMEGAPATNKIGASWVMQKMLDYMHTETPEYLDYDKLQESKNSVKLAGQ